MSVLRGYLLLSLAQVTANFRRSRSITFALLFIGLFAAGVFLAQSHSAPMTVRPSSNDGGMTAKNKSGSVFTSSGANSSSNKHRRDDPSDPAQGCTVNCTATVPATGAVNENVGFAATATTNGCTTQPSFEWNFGDGAARSNQQNPTHAYLAAGAYTWTLTTTASTGSTVIDTIAGGLGEGNLATQAPFGTVIAVARDPQNRGIYVADIIGGATLIRFINTSNSTVTIAGRSIAPGVVRAVAGGGEELGENISGLQSDLGAVSGLDTSPDGNLLYYIAQADGQVRALNVSSSNVTVAGSSIAPGNIGTLASGFKEKVNGLAVNNLTGDVIVADATPGENKISKITTSGAVSVIAGNGATTQPDDAFSAGTALNTPLLQPRAVEVDSQGRVIIADTGHARVIRIESNGNASLLQQFAFSPPDPNPFPSGLAVRGADVYVALANLQTIVRLNSSATTVAGVSKQSCDYSVSNCGDGGPGISATLGLQGSTGNIPLAGLAADANGVFIGDQSLSGRGRIRYLNQSGSAVTLAGVTIAPNAIDRIGGTGLTLPYDGGLATSATFNSPTGVAVDANNNLWIADTLSDRLRFANRGASAVKIFAGTASEQTVQPGSIVTVNKNTGTGPNTDGVPVIQGGFNHPQGLFITGQGIYVVDSLGGPKVPQTPTGRSTSTLRFINTTATTVTIYPSSSSPVSVPPGQIAKIAGGGETQASNGDGGFALAAKFIGSSDVVVDGSGNIYLTDTGGNALRRINGSNGQVGSLLSGKQYTGLGFGPDGRLYITNYTDGTVLRETAVASGTFAVLASGFNKPRDVVVGADGSAYVTVGPPPNVVANNQIVRISSSGTATVVAGTTTGFAGDGGPATAAQLNITPPDLVVGSGPSNQLPETVSIVISPTGEIIFTDTNNNRVRRLSSSTSTCTKTGTITIQGNNPQPQLTSLDPASALIGSGSFTLTVNGSNFVPTSVVNWGGQSRTTTFVSNSQLTAAIPASDLNTAGTVNITIFNPAPGGGTSNALPFTVNLPNPVPTITSLNPNTAVEGSAGFTLTVNGTNFVSDSVVRVDGQPRTTTFVSATRLTAQVLSSDIQGMGSASVTVFNPLPGGGTSNVVLFNITSGQNPAPTLASISPNSATAGGPAFNLTANGTNFVASSTVRWNGTDLTTAFVSTTQLIAQVPANLIVAAGSAQVTVFTPTPGGGVTAAQSFTINPGQPPTVTSVSAASFLGAEIAPESIVAAFGVNMATDVAIATNIPLPTTLLGTKVTVRDSAGTSRDSALFFVAPSQVNYQVPPGTAEGNATVTVTINNNVVGAGTMKVAKVAPGLFTANAAGTGIVSAVVLRIRNGVQTFEPVTATPIDLGPDTDTVYLLAYGVGMRGRTNAANISVNLGGTVKTLNPNLFEDAFAVDGFVGLDQVNIVLPRTLIGKGLINVVLTVDGKISNTVQIAVK
jgi:uncharacterized protein (TIGR03437 family)